VVRLPVALAGRDEDGRRGAEDGVARRRRFDVGLQQHQVLETVRTGLAADRHRVAEVVCRAKSNQQGIRQ